MAKLDEKLKANLAEVPALVKSNFNTERPIESFVSFYEHLDFQEQRIINIIHGSFRDLNLYNIRKEYATRMAIKYQDITTKVEIFKEKRKALKVNIEKLDGTLPYHEIRKVMKVLKETELESFISQFNKQAPIKIPTYYKTEKILEGLEEFGILQSKKIEKGKTKKIWAINPIFAKLYNMIVNTLLIRINEGNSTELDEKYLEIIHEV